jgi:SEC-C motif
VSRKIGRNDPCPCGSGKKYKHCCLAREEATELAWRRLRRADDRFAGEIFRYALERYGEGLLEVAWEEFLLGLEVDVPPRDHPDFPTTFLPWFLFTWTPDLEEPEEPETKARERPEKPPAIAYLEEHQRELDEFEKRFILEACRCRFSFYSTLAIEPGRGLRLSDILTHREVSVIDRSASETVRRGAILYARVFTLDGLSIIHGSSPFAIPPIHQGRIIDLREGLVDRGQVLSGEQLEEFELEIRELYLEIEEDIVHPRLPKLANTDGEPLAPTKMYFDLSASPRDAFEALKTLAVGSTDEELLSDARYGEGDEVRAISFDWLRPGNEMHKGMENTALGRIAIDGTRLIAEVNSRERAEKIRSEIESRLEARVVFRRAVTSSIKKMIEERAERGETVRSRRMREESERIQSLPEVQEQLKAMAGRHWEAWFDEQIPPLGNLTPRQAARTPEGRERLEGLLLSYEWDKPAESLTTLMQPDVAEIRRRLGLA